MELTNRLPRLALERGLPVFPCRPRDKAPACPHGFKDATSDLAKVEAWAREIPGCNWGAALGGDGVFALDVDPRSGGDASLRTLLGINGGFPETLQATTGGGGQHFLFRLASPLEKWPARVAPGLDVKGVGGYIVIEPSTHPNGRPYRWENDAPITLAPAWLERRLRAVTRRILPTKPVNVGMKLDGLTAAAVASMLSDRVVSKAGQYFVRCVCHDEKEPSLALRDGDGGRVLWHCFGRCDQAALTNAIVERIRACRT